MYLRRHLAPTRYLLGPGYVQYNINGTGLDTRIRTQMNAQSGRERKNPHCNRAVAYCLARWIGEMPARCCMESDQLLWQFSRCSLVLLVAA